VFLPPPLRTVDLEPPVRTVGAGFGAGAGRLVLLPPPEREVLVERPDDLPPPEREVVCEVALLTV